MNRRLCSSDNL